ncbi:MAG: hypothetical protein HYW77_01210 [Parcubacteria group bacterium]|nr:hypothetical protein [Parcubacteria group bacterium]
MLKNVSTFLDSDSRAKVVTDETVDTDFDQYIDELATKNQARLTKPELLEQKLALLCYSSLSEKTKKRIEEIRFRAKNIFFHFCKKQEKLDIEYVLKLSDQEKNMLANNFFVKAGLVSKQLANILVGSLVVLLLVSPFIGQWFLYIWYQNQLNHLTFGSIDYLSRKPDFVIFFARSSFFLFLGMGLSVWIIFIQVFVRCRIFSLLWYRKYMKKLHSYGIELFGETGEIKSTGIQ